MADNQNAAPDQEYNDDGSKNPTYVPPKDESESGKSDTKNKDEDKKENEKKDEDDDQKATFDDDAEPQIPVRSSTAQHIIARKNKTIEKLKSKKDDNKGQAPDPDDEDDDDNLSDDARGAIDKAVDERVAPIVQTLITKADEQELKDLFATEPESKKYEKHIKAYMGHEAYKGVSPTVIYHHLAFNTAQAAGAKKKKVADLEADQNKSGGRGLPGKGAVTDLPSAEDIAEMSEEEFEKMETDARQGKYINKK